MYQIKFYSLKFTEATFIPFLNELEALPAKKLHFYIWSLPILFLKKRSTHFKVKYFQ